MIGHVRTARSLAISIVDAERVHVHNFLSQVAFECRAAWVSILQRLYDWTPEDDAVAAIAEAGIPDPEGQLKSLIDLTAVLPGSSPEYELDRQYEEKWKWGVVGGLFHFGTKDIPYSSDAEENRFLRRLLETGLPSPPLYETNDDRDRVVSLPTPLAQQGTEDRLFDVMLSRRSERAMLPTAELPLNALANSLEMGLGITGFVELELRGRLPLRPTPSGGGRNPFEAYVYVRHVQGLEPGLWHYSAVDHTLGLVRAQADGLAPIKDLLADQLWTDEVSAAVFLVGKFDRMWWKYWPPSTYAVVLVEAGHIAQNMVLAAKGSGVASAISACCNHTRTIEALGLDPISDSVIHSVMLGIADPDGDPHYLILDE